MDGRKIQKIGFRFPASPLTLGRAFSSIFLQNKKTPFQASLFFAIFACSVQFSSFFRRQSPLFPVFHPFLLERKCTKHTAHKRVAEYNNKNPVDYAERDKISAYPV